SFTRNKFECLQSWVTGLDVNEGDASLVVLEGSNRYHGDVAKKFKLTDKSDWNLLTPEQTDYYINVKGCRKVSIRCPKGSMVFWDSRTIHCGHEPMKDREEPNFRSIAYICCTPRSLATKKVLEKKV